MTTGTTDPAPPRDSVLRAPRVRLFVSLTALLVVFAAAAVFATRQSLLFAREARVTDTLSLAVAEFRAELGDAPDDRREELLGAIEAAELSLPAGTRLWLFLDGQQVATEADALALPPTGPWAAATRSQQGEFEQRGETFAYLSVPIIGDAATNGVLVATTPLHISPASVQRAVSTVAAVLALLLLPALALAWWLAGRAAGRRMAPVAWSQAGIGTESAPPPPPSDPVGAHAEGAVEGADGAAADTGGGAAHRRRPATPAHAPQPRPAARAGSRTPDAAAPEAAAPDAAAPVASAPVAPSPTDAPGGAAVPGDTTAPAARTTLAAAVPDQPTPTEPAAEAGTELEAVLDGPVSLSQITLDIYAAAQEIDDREWILDVPSTAVVLVDPALVVQAGVLMARVTAGQVGPDTAVVVGGERNPSAVHIYVEALSDGIRSDGGAQSPGGADAGTQQAGTQPAGSPAQAHSVGAAPTRVAPRTAEPAGGRHAIDDLFAEISRIADAHGGRLEIGVGDDASTGLTMVLPQS